MMTKNTMVNRTILTSTTNRTTSLRALQMTVHLVSATLLGCLATVLLANAPLV